MMWCDDFDGDLYALIPDARAVIAPLAAVKLWTTGHETGGKLNHPAVWNGPTPSMIAFFGRTPAPPQPDHYHSGDPLVGCTLEEAVRDLWAHGPIMLRLRVAPGRFVDLWDSAEIQGSFWALLHLARGWTDTATARRADPARERARILDNLHDLVRRALALGLLPAGDPRG